MINDSKIIARKYSILGSQNFQNNIPPNTDQIIEVNYEIPTPKLVANPSSINKSVEIPLIQSEQYQKTEVKQNNASNICNNSCNNCNNCNHCNHCNSMCSCGNLLAWQSICNNLSNISDRYNRNNNIRTSRNYSTQNKTVLDPNSEEALFENLNYQQLRMLMEMRNEIDFLNQKA